MEPATIVLTKAQLLHPCTVGVMRRALHKLAAYEQRKRPRDNGQHGGPERDGWFEVEAACAEYAVAIATGRYWPGDFRSTSKTIDVPPDIEVRYTGYTSGHLLVYDDDAADHRYVLVTGALPRYLIHGWIFGRDATRPEYYGPIAPDRPPAFRVPQEALRPIDELAAAHNVVNGGAII